MYKRALEADPQNANTLANYAALLLADGRPEGLDVLKSVFLLLEENSNPTVALECHFYQFAHGLAAERADALRRLRQLVEQGVRSPGWDLSRNVDRSIQDGHPHHRWLPKLASVLGGEATPEVLAKWPAWRAAGDKPGPEPKPDPKPKLKPKPPSRRK
jgi:hypothetical protein